MSELLLPGEYRTPPVGGEALIQTAETRLKVKDDGVIMVDSPLWDQPYSIGDGRTFTDPRAELFLHTTVTHQFHHFTTRQLSMVEAYETRPGASRFNRLCGLLDSAKLLQDVGGTFEQIFQTVISDLAHPAGSHLRGDYLVGDYRDQNAHDENLITYVVRSGLIDKLQEVGIIDENGYLAGSTASWIELADPRLPRRYDLAECPRPDGNADRNPFTLYEGLVIHDPAEIREAVRSTVRVETEGGERLAMNNMDAARLLFRLAVRHESEHWGDPVRRLIEELVLLPDRAIFNHKADATKKFQQYYPVDYARVDEGEWYRQVNQLGDRMPFIGAVLDIAKSMAAHQRKVGTNYIGNDSYSGPVMPPNMKIEAWDKLPVFKLSIDRDRLYVSLPRPKYRGPIDSLVVTKNALSRVSRSDTALTDFEINRAQWAQTSYVAGLSIPKSLAKDLEPIVAELNSTWFNDQRKVQGIHALNRPNMPKHLLMQQLALAKQRTMDEGRVQ